MPPSPGGRAQAPSPSWFQSNQKKKSSEWLKLPHSQRPLPLTTVPLRLLEFPRYILTSGPLHLLVLPPGMLFPTFYCTIQSTDICIL